MILVLDKGHIVERGNHDVTGKKRISIVCFVYKKDNKSVKSKGVRTWQKESKSLRLVEAAVTPPS
ncbi:hypothetical protein EfmGK941_08520 [Enterococcus faecium]|nr:hypothetical protein EfmGK941_08520 [Enterococcus faecium]